MEFKKGKCMVCGKEREISGGICDECKAMIRDEAVKGQKKMKKDAEKELRKEGVPTDKT